MASGLCLLSIVFAIMVGIVFLDQPLT